MITIACMSLSGGQGKTTVSILLGRYLAQAGFKVLCVDADPQANLTTFLGQQVDDTDPTLLEVLKGTVEPSTAIYETTQKGLSLIPSDNGLDAASEFLAGSGMAVLILKGQLEKLVGFDICLIDSPPQRSQMCVSIIGAAGNVLIPAEASVKGYGSLLRTVDAINEYVDRGATQAKLLGVIPFRDKWVGMNQTNQSKEAIAAMADEVGQDLILPTIRESEKYKVAGTEFKTLDEIGAKDLGYPLEILVEKIGRLINE